MIVFEMASKIQKASISLYSKVLWSCFLGLVQTTSIPLKNLELIVSLPWTSQSSPCPEFRMGDYFTSGVFYSGQVHGKFIDWDVFEL
jgi:hypothetical protein